MNRFGKYELQRRIAIGGMAEIFLARVHGVEGFEKTIVLKRILPHLAEEQDFVHMFIDEAKLASTLAHPNIVQVFELGAIDGRYFIAMEYIPGVDLSSLSKRLWARGQKLPPGAALAIGIEAARGLHYAHEKRDSSGQPLGLVHRDVSPQNVLLSNEGLVKITDFGIAKAEGKSTKTKSGVLKGKFAYMAPEQAFGKVIDRRADEFAIALCLYELLTNKRQYKSDNELEMLDMARTAAIPPLIEVMPEVGPELSAVIAKALAPKAEDRWATCAEFASALVREAHHLCEPYDSDQLAQLVRDNLDAVPAIDSLPEVTDSSILQLSDDEMLTTPLSDVRKIEALGKSKAAVPPPPPADASRVATPPPGKAAWVAAAVAAVAAGATVAWVATRPPAETPAAVAPPAVAAIAPASAPVVAGAPGGTAAVAGTPPPTTGAAAAAPSEDPPPKRAEQAGYLTINSNPWSYVYVDGKKLAKTTPLQRHRVSAGKHRVKLESPGAEKSEEFSIDVRPGQTVTKIHNFKK